MKRYWIRFKTAPDSGLLDTWPKGMQCWTSGWDSEDWDIRCALVDCEGPWDLEPLIDQCFSDWVDAGDWDEKEPDWVPGDRFPGAKTQEQLGLR